MIHLNQQQVKEKYEELDGIAFIQWLTDGYLAAIGGTLTAENMDELSNEQHTVLCYRYLLDEVMEGGFIQLIQNGFAPYVLDGPFPMVVKKVWGEQVGEDVAVMKNFSKLLYAARSEYHRHEGAFDVDMSDEDFMALYEQLEELNELGDDFLDDHQEEVTPLVAQLIVANLNMYA